MSTECGVVNSVRGVVGFDMDVEVTEIVRLTSLSDAVQQSIKRSPKKQAAIASEFAEAMTARGHTRSGNASHFAEMINNLGSSIYEGVEFVDVAIAITGKMYPLEYLAAKHGFKLVRKEVNE